MPAGFGRALRALSSNATISGADAQRRCTWV